MPNAFKIHWSLHNISLILSLVITTVYWTVIHDEHHVVDVTNILTHVSNSLVMFIDLIIISYPVRLLHVVQPLLAGLVYALFSLFYYLAGGVDT